MPPSDGDARSPHLSALQLSRSRGAHMPVPANCAVTGGTGFVGARLVEMLIERGAKRVRCLDVVPPPPTAWRDPRIEYMVGDICNPDDLKRLVDGADCVWHNAAAVGPFHPRDLYFKVNYEGTLNVIEACKAAGVPKIVMSSSPSTRFDGSDVDGLTEAQMPPLPQKRYLQTYAETKAMGELALTSACCDTLLTCSVAPHQVYGPRDNLFLPNLLEAAGTGRLRIFGNGRNRICFTHVDNCMRPRHNPGAPHPPRRAGWMALAPCMHAGSERQAPEAWLMRASFPSAAIGSRLTCPPAVASSAGQTPTA